MDALVASRSSLKLSAISIGYRPEVDGLRAVSVVAVILYHAGISHFSGGFVGVDAFFVISGYVITLAILKEQSEGNFSFAGFYERRARRILPALALVTLCCFPFALAWMTQEDFLDFSKSVAALSVFASNIYFWLEGNYFAPEAATRPLLHTWSLGIEEQFYLLWPVAIVLLWRFGLKVILAFLIVTSCIGVGLAQSLWYSDSIATYYLPHTRLWELEIGAICAIAHVWYGRSENSLLAALGLAMVACAIFLFDDSTPFPSFYALIPTIGAGLFISFAGPRTIPGQLLALRPVVFIGLLSYSAYLWHQPLFAFARIRSLDPLSSGQMSLLIVATFALAAASWRWVETPLRHRGRGRLLERRSVFAAAATTTAVLVGLASYGIANGGENFVNEQISQQMKEISGTYPTQNTKCSKSLNVGSTRAGFCISLNAPHSKKIAVVGDSHSGQIFPAFWAAAKTDGYDVYRALLGGCPPLYGGYMIRGEYVADTCARYGRLLVKRLAEVGVDEVYLVANWSNYDGTSAHYQLSNSAIPVASEKYEETFVNLVRRTIREYSAKGIKVTIVRQVPWQVRDPRIVYPRLLLSGLSSDANLSFVRAQSVTRAEHRSRQAKVNRLLDRAAKSGARVVDLTDDLCDAEICPMGTDKQAYYLDYHHLSANGAALLINSVKNIISP